MSKRSASINEILAVWRNRSHLTGAQGLTGVCSLRFRETIRIDKNRVERKLRNVCTSRDTPPRGILCYVINSASSGTAEFATRANLSVSTRATQWVISRFITVSRLGTLSKMSDVVAYLFGETARGRRRCRRRRSPLVSCSVAIRSRRPTLPSEPAAGTTYIRVYYIEMWRHFLREGEDGITSSSRTHRRGGDAARGGGSPLLNGAEWFRASVLLSPPPQPQPHPTPSRDSVLFTLIPPPQPAGALYPPLYAWLREFRGRKPRDIEARLWLASTLEERSVARKPAKVDVAEWRKHRADFRRTEGKCTGWNRRRNRRWRAANSSLDSHFA